MSDETAMPPSPEPSAPSGPPVPADQPVAAEQPVPFDQPVAAEQPVPFGPPVLSERPERGRRRVALLTAAALVVVAAAGGTGYAVLHHGGSGTDAAAHPTATTPWAEPTPSATKAFGARSGGSHYGSLSLLLVPMPDNYGPGPDVDEFGNDVVLDAGQAQKLVKGDLSSLPAKERKAIAANVDALHIEGAGMRTYTQHDNRLVIQMEIVQMKNEEAARADTKFFAAFTKAMGIFRKGPKIAGHPQATCVLSPKVKGEKLDLMFCQATEGDLMVKMTASGTLPLESAEAATLLRKQLDRVQDPGQAV
ncbi:hypothetical protein [Actinacidiphila acidipaludis]|uniref:Uncharacterized protein n=1 Tax=Actinacidiphila acidipaludis TaxID=2873382 RepID=A0ABS7QEU5_9ACTN|nr:hypothetical protein [Streptomyces acidipaludis]MBY8880950.1 hypothetical protein [Streptomyces acidipaludis]